MYWPLHTSRGKEYLELSTKNMTQRKGHRSRKCAFWNSYLPNLIGMIFYDSFDEYMMYDDICYKYMYISLQKIVLHLAVKMVSVHWRTVLQLKRLSHAPSL